MLSKTASTSEKIISNILSTCRTDAEITEKFTAQDKYKKEISTEQLAARAKIFEGLDPHVGIRFKRYGEQTEEAFNSFERMFMNLTKYELRDHANFQDNHIFTLDTSPTKAAPAGTYYYKKREQPAHARQYKYSGELSEYVRNTARKTETPPAKLTFSIADSERASSDVKKLKGRSGTMLVRSVTFPVCRAERHERKLRASICRARQRRNARRRSLPQRACTQGYGY